MATRARGRIFFKRTDERNAAAISGSMRLREARAFPIHRGGMFARNLRYPRTAEPALDAKSLASLGIPVLRDPVDGTLSKLHQVPSPHYAVGCRQGEDGTGFSSFPLSWVWPKRNGVRPDHGTSPALTLGT